MTSHSGFTSSSFFFSKMTIKSPPLQPRRGLPSETKQCNNCAERCFTQALYCRWCVILDKLVTLDLTNVPRHGECRVCDGPAWVRDDSLCEFCEHQFPEALYIMRYGDYELKHRDQHERIKAIIVSQARNPYGSLKIATRALITDDEWTLTLLSKLPKPTQRTAIWDQRFPWKAES